MPREQIVVGDCPQCQGVNTTCKYNRFESEDLRIDSWEHKCPDCGHRLTTAYRSDDEDTLVEEPMLCPYCGRRAGV
ncbi:hypothetical protein [Lignipirellula cremea]|uniref:Uncharacterized protein n=1 Tax=Lignipirellula cremea TaxID=2528010 RepID=A0A518DUH6_9BACT|nr:hypothetical protein [Lignipirellula cremea]QDU95492.1 hypothetical protein Pla8534_33070 [Lignipirellula cremea]